MRPGLKRLLLIVLAGLLSVLLYFAPRTGAAENKEGPERGPAAADLSVYAGMAVKTLAAEQKQRHDTWLDEKNFDSLLTFWSGNRRPELASYYTEQKAKSSGSAADWKLAGNRYFAAVQFVQDESLVPALYESAARCFREAISLDPSDTDARIMLASCYVQGPKPMEGIAMLREIEKTDSNNVKLQLTFASFSMESGQVEKAIQRYRKALRLDSAYIEIYLHLASAFEQQGDKQATIEMLSAFAQRTGDPQARVEVNRYIQKLRNQ